MNIRDRMTLHFRFFRLRSFASAIVVLLALISSMTSADDSSAAQVQGQSGPCQGAACSPPPPFTKWDDRIALAQAVALMNNLPTHTLKELQTLPVAAETNIKIGKGECLGHQHMGGTSKYKYLANDTVRQAAQVYRGEQGRLRLAMDRYLRGQNITVAFVGGSITAGQGAIDGMAYPSWAANILQHVLGERVKVSRDVHA